jgi:hypothetical protein
MLHDHFMFPHSERFSEIDCIIILTKRGVLRVLIYYGFVACGFAMSVGSHDPQPVCIKSFRLDIFGSDSYDILLETFKNLNSLWSDVPECCMMNSFRPAHPYPRWP